MAAVAKLVVRDTGWARFTKDVHELLQKQGAHVKVGVLDQGPGAAKPDGALSVAEIAAVHEFGSSDGRVPERPFVRPAIERGKPAYLKMLQKLLGDVLVGKRTLEDAFNLVGMQAAADVRAFVVAQDPSWKPLASSTVARKEKKRRRGSEGAVKALIDTGRMIAAITWAFVRG